MSGWEGPSFKTCLRHIVNYTNNEIVHPRIQGAMKYFLFFYKNGINSTKAVRDKLFKNTLGKIC